MPTAAAVAVAVAAAAAAWGLWGRVQLSLILIP